MNTDNFPQVEYPSLKYSLYNLNISRVFQDKIIQIQDNIDIIKEKLNNYEGDKIDKVQENIKLNNILEIVAKFEEECSQD